MYSPISLLITFVYLYLFFQFLGFIGEKIRSILLDIDSNQNYKSTSRREQVDSENSEYTKSIRSLRYLKSSTSSKLCKSNVTSKMSNENIWFDGVNKKLLAAHTSEAKELTEVGAHALVTETPLASLSSYKGTKGKSDQASSTDLTTEVPLASLKACKTSLKPIAKATSSSKVQDRKSFKTTRPRNHDQILPNKSLTDELALDCEMVECYRHKSVLARVSIVNLFGHPVLDQYVAPPAPVTDYRTRYSGIRPKDLVGAPDFDTVQKEVSDMIRGRIVVGHAIHNDFGVLKIDHPPELVRDTSIYFKFLFQGKTPSLKKLTESLLGVKIQKGEHNSVQDAQATMKVYIKERDNWNTKLLKNKTSQVANKKKKQKVKPVKKKKMKTFYVVT